MPGSTVGFDHDVTHTADLTVFRLLPHPRQLPVLPIASDVQASAEVMLIGRGRDRGDPIGNPVTGYLWLTTKTKR